MKYGHFDDSAREYVVTRPNTSRPRSNYLDSRRDVVFISYSQEDRRWLCLLKIVLKPYLRRGLIRIWDDSAVRTGTQWKKELASALRRARVGVLLTSTDYFASDFVNNVELPALRRAAARGELTLFCVPVRPADPRALRLQSYQWARDPKRPLSRMSRPAREQALVAIVEELVALFGRNSRRTRRPRAMSRMRARFAKSRHAAPCSRDFDSPRGGKATSAITPVADLTNSGCWADPGLRPPKPRG
ncbi:MAG TPA: TIR domain-containing protein [Polyangiaceae bacterium]|nr:TIR domain-containing protein [Polyangiaceae bacterium]